MTAIVSIGILCLLLAQFVRYMQAEWHHQEVMDRTKVGTVNHVTIWVSAHVDNPEDVADAVATVWKHRSCQ